MSLHLTLIWRSLKNVSIWFEVEKGEPDEQNGSRGRSPENTRLSLIGCMLGVNDFSGLFCPVRYCGSDMP
jgi:hypothetical protein